MMMTRRRHHDVSSSLRWKSWHLWVFFCFFFWCLPLMKTSFCCFKRAYSKRLNDLIPEMKTKTEKSEVRTRRHLFSIQISNRPPSAGMVPVYLSSSILKTNSSAFWLGVADCCPAGVVLVSLDLSLFSQLKLTGKQALKYLRRIATILTRWEPRWPWWPG